MQADETYDSRQQKSKILLGRTKASTTRRDSIANSYKNVAAEPNLT